jgi:hypothetical protein
VDNLNLEKLSVTYRGVSPTEPIAPRLYSLTRSDNADNYFLVVGSDFSQEQPPAEKDEFLAEWRRTGHGNQYMLYGRVRVDAQSGRKKVSAFRSNVFQHEIPIALEAIRLGERTFFLANPTLDFAPIYVYFESIYPEYNQMQYWGVPADYAK